MAFKLVYHHDIPKDILDFPSNIKDRIKHAIQDRLLSDPFKFGYPLRRDLYGYRKLRVGDYRVIYKMDGENILIFKIGHRKNVYEKLARRLGL